jgi:protein SERAC1
MSIGLFQRHCVHWRFSKALEYSKQSEGLHVPIFAIFNATKGVVFLGTPHRGTGHASLASIIVTIARLSLKDTNDSIVRVLEHRSETLARIADPFNRMVTRREVKVFSFVEELVTTGFGRVCKI